VKFTLLIEVHAYGFAFWKLETIFVRSRINAVHAALQHLLNIVRMLRDPYYIKKS
jgi:hypothetical protein